MKHKTISPVGIAVILAAFQKAKTAIDLHSELSGPAREKAEIDGVAAINCALRVVNGAPDAGLVVPIEILDHAREWTRGDLHAAEMSGENKTEIDVDTLRARMAALDRMEKGE